MKHWSGSIMLHPVANGKDFHCSGNVALETPLETCCCLQRKSPRIRECACVYVCVITGTAHDGYHISGVLSPLLIGAQMCQKLRSRGSMSKAEWEQLILHVYPNFSAVIACRMLPIASCGSVCRRKLSWEILDHHNSLHESYCTVMVSNTLPLTPAQPAFALQSDATFGWHNLWQISIPVPPPKSVRASTPMPTA